LSSRNLRLSADERIKAAVFFQALELGKKMLRQKASLTKVKSAVKQMIETIPGVRLEYFEIADSENLTLLENVESSARPILLVAGYVGEIRLIDNMLV
jgi:pantoate--beta-alanine ligase